MESPDSAADPCSSALSSVGKAAWGVGYGNLAFYAVAALASAGLMLLLAAVCMYRCSEPLPRVQQSNLPFRALWCLRATKRMCFIGFWMCLLQMTNFEAVFLSRLGMATGSTLKLLEYLWCGPTMTLCLVVLAGDKVPAQRQLEVMVLAGLCTGSHFGVTQASTVAAKLTHYVIGCFIFIALVSRLEKCVRDHSDHTESMLGWPWMGSLYVRTVRQVVTAWTLCPVLLAAILPEGILPVATGRANSFLLSIVFSNLAKAHFVLCMLRVYHETERDKLECLMGASLSSHETEDPCALTHAEMVELGQEGALDILRKSVAESRATNRSSSKAHKASGKSKEFRAGATITMEDARSEGSSGKMQNTRSRGNLQEFKEETKRISRSLSRGSVAQSVHSKEGAKLICTQDFRATLEHPAVDREEHSGRIAECQGSAKSVRASIDKPEIEVGRSKSQQHRSDVQQQKRRKREALEKKRDEQQLLRDKSRRATKSRLQQQQQKQGSEQQSQQHSEQVEDVSEVSFDLSEEYTSEVSAETWVSASREAEIYSSVGHTESLNSVRRSQREGQVEAAAPVPALPLLKAGSSETVDGSSGSQAGSEGRRTRSTRCPTDFTGQPGCRAGAPIDDSVFTTEADSNTALGGNDDPEDDLPLERGEAQYIQRNDGPVVEATCPIGWEAERPPFHENCDVEKACVNGAADPQIATAISAHEKCGGEESSWRQRLGHKDDHDLEAARVAEPCAVNWVKILPFQEERPELDCPPCNV